MMLRFKVVRGCRPDRADSERGLLSLFLVILILPSAGHFGVGLVFIAHFKLLSTPNLKASISCQVGVTREV